jgi:GDP-L-fucose synthase
MKLFIAGHNEMVDGTLVRRFEKEAGFSLISRTRQELDLTDQAAVKAFYLAEKPDVVIMAAARIGGIHANGTYHADFAYDNLVIATNTIHGDFRAGVKRFLFLGSSCIYPKHAPQPMAKTCLLTGPLERTNEAYAIAKIAGLKLCEYYLKQHGVLLSPPRCPPISMARVTTIIRKNSHVLPVLLRRFDEAKDAGSPDVVAWGTGSPRREFLHVDDLADARALLLRQENPPDLVNIGTGIDITTIKELTELVAKVTDFQGSHHLGSHQTRRYSAQAHECLASLQLGLESHNRPS